MKKYNKLSKFLTICIAVAMGISVFATGCNNDKGNSTTVTPVSPVVDSYERGELTNTLHKVNVIPNSQRKLAYNDGGIKKTDYVIIADSASSHANRAAAFISQQLGDASDASFPVKPYTAGESIEVNENSKYIILGCEDLFKSCGLTMPEESLGPAGYYIKSYGDNVFLMSHMIDGYQMGAIAFLKAVVGYDMIAHDTVVFENEGETLPDLDIIERPDYDYRNYTNWMTDSGKYGMGYGYTHIFALVGANRRGVHNSLEYIPFETYGAEHSSWYSAHSGAYRQVCYTAHGNEEEYGLMQEIIIDKMMEEIIAQPEQGIITFTSEDNYNCCECDACTEIVKQDGSISATVIRFINDLDEKLQARLEKYAEENSTSKREMQIAFFAYQAYASAPTTSAEQDPTLKCSPNVSVFIAPIEAKYVYSFYEDENEVYANMIRKWTNYTDNIIAWVYETDYHHYMFPYNTYSSMVDTYYFFKQCGANIIYNEGQRNNENVTCFGKLKEYLDAKAQIDVTISYEEYKDKFFKNYYGAAAPIMEEYYNQLREWETYLESVTEYGLGAGVYQEIGSDKRFWPKQLLEGWLELIDKAYKAVAYLETENPAEYAKLVKHIKIETLFPRYALCTLHEASYTKSQITELRIAFKKDADELGIVEQMEHGNIVSDIYAMWGLA